MPFPVGHAIVAAGLFATLQPKISYSEHGRILLLCAAVAVLPDVDFVFEWVFNLPGWHRGFTHSITFGLVFGLIASSLVRFKNFRTTIGLLLASLSHAPLDALVTSSEGTGVKLLWPLSGRRFHFGAFDYFYFDLDPRFDPWLDILTHFLKISLIELIIAGPLLLLLLLIKRKPAN